MNPTLAGLRHEHFELLNELHALDRTLLQCSAGEMGCEDLLETVRQLRVLIRERLLPHCVRERRLLLPLLRSTTEGRALAVLLNDDHMLRREERLLTRLLQDLENEKGHAVGQIVAAGERIIAVLIEHIHQEERHLFPLVESLGEGREGGARTP
jgi:hemerythrin-like domain-containing protein